MGAFKEIAQTPCLLWRFTDPRTVVYPMKWNKEDETTKELDFHFKRVFIYTLDYEHPQAKPPYSDLNPNRIPTNGIAFKTTLQDARSLFERLRESETKHVVDFDSLERAESEAARDFAADRVEEATRRGEEERERGLI